MNFLVIDGNSILNRAFYGIKVLTTKDGRFTNAIYGFMNIFLRLKDECQPQAMAVAFDVKQPFGRTEVQLFKTLFQLCKITDIHNNRRQNR